MIDFVNLDEIKFNIKAVHDSEVRMSLTEQFERFTKEHDGEMWTSMLLCMLYTEMEHVSSLYGYELAPMREDNILHVKVVRDETL